MGQCPCPKTGDTHSQGAYDWENGNAPVHNPAQQLGLAFISDDAFVSILTAALVLAVATAVTGIVSAGPTRLCTLSDARISGNHIAYLRRPALLSKCDARSDSTNVSISEAASEASLSKSARHCLSFL